MLREFKVHDNGPGDEARTRNIHLGRVTHYQLCYPRIGVIHYHIMLFFFKFQFNLFIQTNSDIQYSIQMGYHRCDIQIER